MNTAQITPQRAFRLAIQAYPTQAAFAKAVGKSRAWVSQQLSDVNSETPAEMVLTIERETGLKRYLLRPDLYPPEEYANV